MTNILIIGNGVHALRYLKTYIFYEDLKIWFYEYDKKSNEIIAQYGVNKETNLKKITNYDVIFLSLPIDERKIFFDRIVLNNYKGIILFEKPLALKYHEAEDIIKRAKNLKLGVIYNRQFENKINFFEEFYDKKLIVKWPNLSKDHIDPIVNTMANILDTLFLICGYSTIDNLYIEQNNNNYNIIFNLNSVEIEIEIYDTDNIDDKVTINNKILQWPNYFETNTNIIRKILSGSYDFKNNCENALINVRNLEIIENYLR